MKFNKKGEMTVGKVIALLIFVVIALALLPTIISSVNSGRNATNTSANQNSRSMIALISIVYVIGVLLGAIAWVVIETRGEGL